jgi:hypothetical protein
MESICASRKMKVICSKISPKFDGVSTDTLPEVQLSIFAGKCHILFVYLRDSNGVSTGDR